MFSSIKNREKKKINFVYKGGIVLINLFLIIMMKKVSFGAFLVGGFINLEK